MQGRHRSGDREEAHARRGVLLKTRAQAAGLLSFKYKERKDGRGQDARDVCEVEIRLNPAKFNALVKLGERLGAFKQQTGPTDGLDIERLLAEEAARREYMVEICSRYDPPAALPKPEKAKVKGS